MQATVFILTLILGSHLIGGVHQPSTRYSWPEIERQIQRHRDRVRWCGLLSTAQALRLLGHNFDVNPHLASLRDGDPRGMPIADLLRICRDHQPQARLVRIPGKRYGQLCTPCILFLNDDSHAVVLTSWSYWKQTADIWDPSDLRSKTLRLNQLSSLWTGHAVLLNEPTWTSFAVGGLTAVAATLMLIRRFRRRLRPYATRYCFAAMLICHAALVVGVARRTTPNADEPAHLAAGIYHWQTGQFDAYRVNPPLVRLWCTWPLLFRRDVPQLPRPIIETHDRLEWRMEDLLWSHWTFAELREHLFLARLLTLPINMAGGIYCWRWASLAYGRTAGWVAWAFWITSPNLLAWSATLCPDVAATSIGLAACYHFRQWSIGRRSSQLWLTGFACGLAILAKSTWCILPVLIITAAYWIRSRRDRSLRIAAPLCGAICLSVLTVNLGYGMKDTVPQIGELPLRSRLLQSARDLFVCNPISGNTLASVRLPLPRDFILGIDQQRLDFERRKWSYLAGQWRLGSWPYYYVACFIWKVPVGVLLLFILSLFASLGIVWQFVRKWRAHYELVADELLASWFGMGMAIAISSQTGFGHHFRYAFPCLPFVWIQSSSCFATNRPRWLRHLAVPLVAWTMTSSAAAWPRCHSYFNDFARWTCQTPPLLESNLEWGEDLEMAATWLRQHPSARPAFHAVMTDDLADRMNVPWKAAPSERIDGWYVVSLQRVLDPRDRFSHLRFQVPVAKLGDSLRVYRITGVGRREEKKGISGRSQEPRPDRFVDESHGETHRPSAGTADSPHCSHVPSPARGEAARRADEGSSCIRHSRGQTRQMLIPMPRWQSRPYRADSAGRRVASTIW